VALSPGGEHLMLLGLKRSRKAGEQVVITLRFEHAGSVDATFPVVDARTR
jgi:copper(I)-binding protein